MAAAKKKRTRQQIISDFKDGLAKANSNIKEWAREHEFNIEAVYSITRGQNKGQRGKGREILEMMEKYHAS